MILIVCMPNDLKSLEQIFKGEKNIMVSRPEASFIGWMFDAVVILPRVSAYILSAHPHPKAMIQDLEARIKVPGPGKIIGLV